MKKVLLMSITDKDSWLTELQYIREIYIPEKKILVFCNRFDEEDNKVWITFNTKIEYNFKRDNIVRINRNKDTNTLFSINAINELSIRETGKVDKGFIPNWNEFENCLLIKNLTGLAVIPTKLMNIVNIN
jgi:hypothetical protein